GFRSLNSESSCPLMRSGNTSLSLTQALNTNSRHIINNAFAFLMAILFNKFNFIAIQEYLSVETPIDLGIDIQPVIELREKVNISQNDISFIIDIAGREQAAHLKELRQGI